MLELIDGEPLRFGLENNKGIVDKGGHLEIAVVGENGVTEDDILVHDIKNAGLAAQLALLEFPDDPYPIGIFRQVDEACYGEITKP